MNLLTSNTFFITSNDHQQVALFQTKVQFWACFVGAWLMFALGLIPIAFLLLMPPQPLTLKIAMFCVTAVCELFSLCFTRGLKQARKWLDDHYDRLRRDERMLQARQLVESIQDRQLRDTMRAEMARLFGQESRVEDYELGSIKNVLLRRLLIKA